jgi:hypothetical protein
VKRSVEDDSTVKEVGRPRKLDWDKLRAQGVDEDPSEDERARLEVGFTFASVEQQESESSRKAKAAGKRRQQESEASTMHRRFGGELDCALWFIEFMAG